MMTESQTKTSAPVPRSIAGMAEPVEPPQPQVVNEDTNDLYDELFSYNETDADAGSETQESKDEDINDGAAPGTPGTPCVQDVSEESVDIYSEMFPSEFLTPKRRRKSAEIHSMYQQCLTAASSLEVQNQQLLGEISSLKEENIRLKENISSLYQTAKAEVGRKDREMYRLRKQVWNFQRQLNNARQGVPIATAPIQPQVTCMQSHFTEESQIRSNGHGPEATCVVGAGSLPVNAIDTVTVHSSKKELCLAGNVSPKKRTAAQRTLDKAKEIRSKYLDKDRRKSVRESGQKTSEVLRRRSDTGKSQELGSNRQDSGKERKSRDANTDDTKLEKRSSSKRSRSNDSCRSRDSKRGRVRDYEHRSSSVKQSSRDRHRKEDDGRRTLSKRDNHNLRDYSKDKCDYRDGKDSERDRERRRYRSCERRSSRERQKRYDSDSRRRHSPDRKSSRKERKHDSPDHKSSRKDQKHSSLDSKSSKHKTSERLRHTPRSKVHDSPGQSDKSRYSKSEKLEKSRSNRSHSRDKCDESLKSPGKKTSDKPNSHDQMTDLTKESKLEKYMDVGLVNNEPGVSPKTKTDSKFMSEPVQDDHLFVKTTVQSLVNEEVPVDNSSCDNVIYEKGCENIKTAPKVDKADKIPPSIERLTIKSNVTVDKVHPEKKEMKSSSSEVSELPECIKVAIKPNTEVGKVVQKEDTTDLGVKAPIKDKTLECLTKPHEISSKEQAKLCKNVSPTKELFKEYYPKQKIPNVPVVENTLDCLFTEQDEIHLMDVSEVIEASVLLSCENAMELPGTNSPLKSKKTGYGSIIQALRFSKEEESAIKAKKKADSMSTSKCDTTDTSSNNGGSEKANTVTGSKDLLQETCDTVSRSTSSVPNPSSDVNYFACEMTLVKDRNSALDESSSCNSKSLDGHVSVSKSGYVQDSDSSPMKCLMEFYDGESSSCNSKSLDGHVSVSKSDSDSSPMKCLMELSSCNSKSLDGHVSVSKSGYVQDSDSSPMKCLMELSSCNSKSLDGHVSVSKSGYVQDSDSSPMKCLMELSSCNSKSLDGHVSVSKSGYVQDSDSSPMKCLMEFSDDDELGSVSSDDSEMESVVESGKSPLKKPERQRTSSVSFEDEDLRHESEDDKSEGESGSESSAGEEGDTDEGPGNESEELSRSEAESEVEKPEVDRVNTAPKHSKNNTVDESKAESDDGQVVGGAADNDQDDAVSEESRSESENEELSSNDEVYSSDEDSHVSERSDESRTEIDYSDDERSELSDNMGSDDEERRTENTAARTAHSDESEQSDTDHENTEDELDMEEKVSDDKLQHSDLKVVDESQDCVVSSSCQPDDTDHLNQMELEALELELELKKNELVKEMESLDQESQESREMKKIEEQSQESGRLELVDESMDCKSDVHEDGDIEEGELTSESEEEVAAPDKQSKQDESQDNKEESGRNEQGPVSVKTEAGKRPVHQRLGNLPSGTRKRPRSPEPERSNPAKKTRHIRSRSRERLHDAPLSRRESYCSDERKSPRSDKGKSSEKINTSQSDRHRSLHNHRHQSPRNERHWSPVGEKKLRNHQEKSRDRMRSPRSKRSRTPQSRRSRSPRKISPGRRKSRSSRSPRQSSPHTGKSLSPDHSHRRRSHDRHEKSSRHAKKVNTKDTNDRKSSRDERLKPHDAGRSSSRKEATSSSRSRRHYHSRDKSRSPDKSRSRRQSPGRRRSCSSGCSCSRSRTPGRHYRNKTSDKSQSKLQSAGRRRSCSAGCSCSRSRSPRRRNRVKASGNQRSAGRRRSCSSGCSRSRSRSRGQRYHRKRSRSIRNRSQSHSPYRSHARTYSSNRHRTCSPSCSRSRSPVPHHHTKRGSRTSGDKLKSVSSHDRAKLKQGHSSRKPSSTAHNTSRRDSDKKNTSCKDKSSLKSKEKSAKESPAKSERDVTPAKQNVKDDNVERLEDMSCEVTIQALDEVDVVVASCIVPSPKLVTVAKNSESQVNPEQHSIEDSFKTTKTENNSLKERKSKSEVVGKKHVKKSHSDTSVLRKKKSVKSVNSSSLGTSEDPGSAGNKYIGENKPPIQTEKNSNPKDNVSVTLNEKVSTGERKRDIDVKSLGLGDVRQDGSNESSTKKTKRKVLKSASCGTVNSQGLQCEKMEVEFQHVQSIGNDKEKPIKPSRKAKLKNLKLKKSCSEEGSRPALTFSECNDGLRLSSKTNNFIEGASSAGKPDANPAESENAVKGSSSPDKIKSSKQTKTEKIESLELKESSCSDNSKVKAAKPKKSSSSEKTVRSAELKENKSSEGALVPLKESSSSDKILVDSVRPKETNSGKAHLPKTSRSNKAKVSKSKETLNTEQIHQKSKSKILSHKKSSKSVSKSTEDRSHKAK